MDMSPFSCKMLIQMNVIYYCMDVNPIKKENYSSWMKPCIILYRNNIIIVNHFLFLVKVCIQAVYSLNFQRLVFVYNVQIMWPL